MDETLKGKRRIVMFISSKVLKAAKYIKHKSAHSLGQNIIYMISFAWRQRRSVILLVLTMAASAILLNLATAFYRTFYT